MTSNPDTSTARVERVCAAFAVDLQHSCDVANAVDLLRALAGERDQLKAELAGALDEVISIFEQECKTHTNEVETFFEILLDLKSKALTTPEGGQ